MNQLLEKFCEFREIVGFQFEYEFENGDYIKFKLKQTDFPHLIGLHKLTDIPMIRQLNDKNIKVVSASFILSKIRQERYLTEETIRKSSYFSLISNRFDSFSKESILSLIYTDVVVDFDSSLINSKLTAKYILFERKSSCAYNHLCVAENLRSEKYAESFFYEPTDLYVRNQKTLKVKKVRILDKDKNVYLEEEF